MKAFLFALVVLLYGNSIFCQDLALVGAKIYPSPTGAPIEKGVILIRKGKIAAVGSGDKIVVPKTMTVIDCRGLVLTAAFWNCHVHFIEPKWQDADLIPPAQFNNQMAQMITSHGFAHVFDLAELSIGTVLRIRDRIKKGEVSGPVIYTAGVPLTPLNGNPFYIEPLKLPEASDPQQAAAHVRQQIDSGADAIKIWTGSPVGGGKTVYMPEEIVRQMTQTAHNLGKPVFSHPTDTKGVMIALDGGVDILAHTAPQDGRAWSADTIRRMLTAHLALIPTLKLWKYELQKGGAVDWAHTAFMLTAQQQLHDFSKAGGTVLFGTDVGYVPDYSTGDEYTLMAGSGLSFSQILAALTTTPAQRFGLGARTGRIAVGMDADIVLLKADPALDIRSFDKVVYTFCQGKIIYRNIPPETAVR
jgi:imidazolonepropionase-like amidohydrolase